jgi:ribosome-associated heat shock protein Hsp15
MRLDVLLHELRLFRSRSQAAAAIEAGRVRVDGRAAKASRGVEPGACITLIGEARERTLEVLALPQRSMRKADAQKLVREIPRETARGGPA